jgi:uncharacterized protein with HEPN domain
MKQDDYTRIRHMADAAEEAVSFLGNLDANDLSNNRLVCQAVVRSLEIIGEAAINISQSYRDNHPEIPWPKIKGMRNRLVHAYFEIDYEVIEKTVKLDLPDLIEILKKLIDESKKNEALSA